MSVRLKVFVKPGSSLLKFGKESENGVEVFLTSKPEDGKANKQLIELFSKTFKLAKSSIIIETGFNSKHKIIAIHTEKFTLETLKEFIKNL